MPFANNQGVRIHYEIEGQGPPLLMQYGQYFPLEVWRYLNYVDALKHHCQLILVDARGHGQSDKPYDSEAYRIEHKVKDILAVLDDLGLEKTHYMGYSSGGHLGFGIAKYAPDRVYSLILGGTFAYAESSKDRSWDLDQIEKLEKQTAVEFVEELEGFMQSLGFPPFTPGLKAGMLRHDLRSLVAWHRFNLELVGFGFDEIITTIPVPCLIYAGDQSREYSLAQRTSQEIPKAAFVSIPGGGHLEGGTWIELLKLHILKHLGIF
jgi:pimeloyl-ACP methyl ester carboxylesterase